VRWAYRVHEQILPAITAASIPIRWTEVEIGHLGYVDGAVCGRKLDRNLRILRAELQEKPGNPLILFNIGWAAIYRNDPKTALGYLRASLASSSPQDALIRKVYALIAQAHQMLGQPASALAACVDGRSLAPDDAGLLFREAQLRRDRGDLDGAEVCWRRILEGGRPHNFSIVLPGVYGHLTRRKLAALAERRGDVAVAECPGDPEASHARARLVRPSYAIVASAG
jgi:tetratricopeptide (TPR) repeat protein